MAALTDPISGLSYGWALGEDNWNTGMDSNLVQLGATVNITVLDFVASPVVTTNGTRYIVTTGSGDFVGQDNKLAARVAGAWVFYTLPEGCIVYDEDTNVHYKFEGGSYVLAVDLSSYLTSATAASTYTSITNSRYQFVTAANTTYAVLAADVTNNGRVIVKCTNADAIAVTIATPSSLGVSTGDSVNIRQGNAGIVTISGALEGNGVFTAQHETKTLIAQAADTWLVVGG